MREQTLIFPPNSRTQRRVPLGPRTALFIGFGMLLALMALMSLDALRILAAIEDRNTEIRRDFLLRERTLAQVRSGLYESGNIVRDYILSAPIQSTSDLLRNELQSIQDDTSAGLQTCIRSLPPAQRVPFQHLAEELERYWAAIDPIFRWSAKEKQERGDAFLRNDVLSQHAEVLAIARDTGAVNDQELKDAETEIADVFAQFRRRFGVATAAALILGFVLAAATIAYSSGLEKLAEERYHRSLEAQRELKKLSKRLVDAQEQERRAISRELHDEVGQSLSALLVDLENLSSVSGADGAFRKDLKNIKTLAENCVNEVRDMALLLRPSMLDDLGLGAALEWQAREVSKRTGMLVEMTQDQENALDGLPEEYKICVYRIVQEALNNCSKHAHAKQVQVMVHHEPKRLLVTIQDDGRGFDPIRVQGLGLVGMNERVNQLGGVLSVNSDAACGTLLSVDLPLPGLEDRVDQG